MVSKIFVTVGTHPQQFNRLLEEIDRLVDRGKINWDVFAQIGHSTYEPDNYRYVKFLDKEKFMEKIKEADIVITHGGEGNIGEALQQKKRIIMVPRLQSYGEHTNDHQLELVEAVEKEGRAIAVHDISELLAAIEGIKVFTPKTYEGNKGIIKLLKQFAKENFNA